jgi:hypothetical protein
MSRAALIAAQLKRRLGHAAGSSGDDVPVSEPSEAAQLCRSIREALARGGASDSGSLHALQQAAAALLAAPQ